MKISMSVVTAISLGLATAAHAGAPLKMENLSVDEKTKGAALAFIKASSEKVAEQEFTVLTNAFASSDVSLDVSSMLAAIPSQDSVRGRMGWSSSAGGCYSNCYSNCHGSRGWR